MVDQKLKLRLVEHLGNDSIGEEDSEQVNRHALMFGYTNGGNKFLFRKSFSKEDNYRFSLIQAAIQSSIHGEIKTQVKKKLKMSSTLKKNPVIIGGKTHY